MSPPADAEGAQHHSALRRGRDGVLVFLVAALWLGLGTDLELFARDEPRYAATSRQMLESGDWITPVFNGELRYRQPPGIYWLQAASLALAGPSGLGLCTERAVRLPSVLAAALAAAWLYAFLGRETSSRRAGLLAALLFVVCPMVAIEARAATTDSTLAAGLVLLLTGLYELRTGRRPPLVWLPWGVLLGALLLVKGPVPLLVLLSAWLAWAVAERRRPATDRRTSAARGFIAGAFVLALLTALPWAVAAHLRTGGLFTELALSRQLAPRLASAVEGHGGNGWLFFPWLLFYPAVLALLAFPASIHLFDRAGTGADQRIGGRATRLRTFLWSWLLGPLVAFTLLPTKLFHYVLPVVPPIAMLAALPLAGASGSLRRRPWLVAASVTLSLLLCIGPLLGAAAAGLDALLPALAAAAAVSLPPLLLGARALRRQRPLVSLRSSAAGVALLSLVLVLAAGPIFDAAYKAGPAAGRAARERAPEDAIVWRWLYGADTVPFYAERLAPLVEEAFSTGAGDDRLVPFERWASEPEHRWLVLDRRHAEDLASRVPGGAARLDRSLDGFERRGRWEGRYDYEHGRFVDVELWERTSR